MTYKIHITGASGSGVSTLGKSLARVLGVPLLDTDDYYWEKTQIPFTEKRPVLDRLRDMRHDQGRGGWIVAGSLMGWGEDVVRDADLVVLLTAPRDLRLERLRAREAARFGNRVREGGDMYLIHECFLGWASRYDDPNFGGRSLRSHQMWLEDMGLPVLKLNAQRSPSHLARQTVMSLIAPVFPWPVPQRAEQRITA